MSEPGVALNVHYGDVLIKFGEYLDASTEEMAFIPNQAIVDKFKGSFLADGDIVMADTAEDETVGKCSEIARLQGKTAISGLHTIPLRPIVKFAPGFLGYYMNSGAYHDQLLPLMQGIKVTSVSKNAIRNTDISYPSDTTEQAAIGQYFIRLDHLITLHQRKYYPFHVHPQIAILLFPFVWEQRKLGELAVFNPKAELPDVFEYVDLESVVGTEMLSHRTETKRTAPSRAQRLAQTGDLFYQTVRPYQKNNYLFEKSDKHYVFSTGYAQMRPVMDGRFLLCLVQSDGFVKVVLDNCTGTSYPAINSNDLAEIEVCSPGNPQEQAEIGDFFKGLDDLITLHQRGQSFE